MKKAVCAMTGLLFVCCAISSFGVVVQEVRVVSRGPTDLETESVMAYISIKKGDEFSHQALTQDIKNLKQSNRFSYVDVAREDASGGIALIYMLTEKPKIRRLRISGADELGNRKVRELMELGVGDYVDDSTLGARSKKVTAEYQKKLFPFAKITWTMQVEESTGLADVDVLVKEGEHAGVGRISFTGNTVFTDKQIRAVMKQGVRRWWSWITGSGVYDPDLLSADLKAIQDLYLDKGYLDVRAETPVMKLNEHNKIEITIAIYEGQPYRLGTIKLSGPAIFPQEEVYGQVRLQPDQVASASAIRDATRRVQDFYGSRGYLDTRVQVERDADPQTGVADLSFEVREGRLSYIRDIQITGNTRTKDKVIRRELAVYPGEIANEVKVRTSERRLQNLGYFEFVNSSFLPTTRPGYFDLLFDVEEKRTGQFMVGAGFSSIDELIAFVELGQGNFDLFGWPNFTGAGQKMKFRATVGNKRRDYEISFTEPWFLDRKLSLGVDLFQNESRYYSDEYEQKNLGGSVSLTKPLTSYDRLTFTYTLQQVDVFNVDDEASEEIKSEEGKTVQSSFGPRLQHDTRDNYFVPTRGNRTILSAILSGGPFAGDVDIYTLSVKSSQHWPVWYDHVLTARGEMAVVDAYGDSDRVRIFDRQFLGGPRNLRGFKYRHVGPVDNAEDQEPIGGNTMAFGTLEYEVPVFSKLRLAAFYDMGMVYKDAYSFSGEDYTGDYNSDYGFGLRLDIPGFPLRLDYAWPLKAGEYNDRDSGRFSFLIGYVL